MLESLLHPVNSFVTLTYNDSSIPIQSATGLATLLPVHLQNFLKKLRKQLEPSKIRFYAVGEYGDETFRPHYHLALFNFPTCARGNTGAGMVRPSWAACCDNCRTIGNTWGHGNVLLGTLETSSAQYVAGYVTKKMTHRLDPRLLGREPEFARMSLRPGIGSDFMHEVASTLLQFNLEKTRADVPSALEHGKGRKLPLGRYLQKKLRTLVGQNEAAPQETLDKVAAEMLPLRLAAKTSKTHPSLKSQVVLSGTTGRLRLEQKQRLYTRKKSL